MTLTDSRRLELDSQTGAFAGAPGTYEKRLRDLEGLYLDEAAFTRLVTHQGDRVVYRVHDYKPSARTQDLIVGTSTLEPGKIGDEYFMTRGHIHAIADRPEVYHCVHGHGVMLMENLEGEVDAIEMKPGTVSYVGPSWIHRSVNVGSDRFVTVFVYPADSGQDYEIIAKAGGMASLVVADGDGWTLIDNPRYSGRS